MKVDLAYALMTINILKQLFFMAVAFSLVLHSSGLKKASCIFTTVREYIRYVLFLAVWKTCLP